MIYARLTPRPHLLACFAALALWAGGCSGSRSNSTGPGPLENRDSIATVLPKGVTLETPVVPNAFYGESSKTVEDALRHLRAYVRENVLYDGGMGHDIRFESGTPASPKKAVKKSKDQAPYMIINLAK